jgi:hypothetical protein
MPSELTRGISAHKISPDDLDPQSMKAIYIKSTQEMEQHYQNSEHTEANTNYTDDHQLQ